MEGSPSVFEQRVMAIYQLRTEPSIRSVDESTLKQIVRIRDLCQTADKQDILSGGQFGWRRPSNQSSSHASSSQSAGKLPINSPRWRGGPGSSRPSQKPHTAVSGEKSQSRYVSKFQNTETPVEDKILNQVILNKLNKFSGANYEEVKAFLQQILDSDEKEFLRDFMLLVFKKAASEPTFCPLYARMISELCAEYSTLVEELTKLYTKYLTIFEDVSEQDCKDYESFVQRNREKLHRLGYSQFLAELASRGVLSLEQLTELFVKILEQIKKNSAQESSKQQLVEEYVDCLVRMSKAFQTVKSPELLKLRSELAAVCDPLITEILSNRSQHFPGLSKKASFGLMDCLDMFR
jgi:hypothetical protein